jgi:NADH-quinone oxidoreductase subunit N
VNFSELLQETIRDIVAPNASLWAFRPELTLCATIIAILLVRMALPRWTTSSFYMTIIGVAVAFFYAMPHNWLPGSVMHASPIFSNVLVFDRLSVGLRFLLLLFAILYTTFTQITGVSNREDMTEFYVLMLGALLGMCLMVSTNHILIMMLGVEMASVPCYVLAGIQRQRSRSSEASMKYAVFGACSAGVMLYGMSLLVGLLGSAHLPTMAVRLAALLQNGAAPDHTMVLVLGGLLLIVGVAFKLSAFPFHFWIPDVFEGTTAEVAAFLSIASKMAALGLLVRLSLGFSFYPDPAIVAALAPVRHYIVLLVSLLSVVTCTFGNLAAYGQTNMKRLLAYSTIAHAGYMMMPIAAAVALIGTNLVEARGAIASLCVYLAIYMAMNLAAFAIVAILRNAIHSEEIADYSGLVRRSPGLTVCMALVMFSLVGLPPFAGFAGKLFVFAAVLNAKLWIVLAAGLLNTVLSLFYYLRVVKVMVLSPEPLHRQSPRIPLLKSMAGLYCMILTLPVVVLFFLAGGLLNLAQAAASSLLY